MRREQGGYFSAERDAKMCLDKAVNAAIALNEFSPGSIIYQTELIKVGRALSQFQRVVHGDVVSFEEVVDTARKFALRDQNQISGQLILQGFAAERATLRRRSDLLLYNQLHNALQEEFYGIKAK